MPKILFVTIGLMCTLLLCRAQVNTLPGTTAPGGATGIKTVECLGFVNPPSEDLILQPFLTHKISENDGPDQQEILKIKAEAEKLRAQNAGRAEKMDGAEQAMSSVPMPVVGKNFLGNYSPSGCPEDNTIAVSKGGKMVCVVNSILNYYDITVGSYSSYTYSKTLKFFYKGLGVSSNLCDPKVIYDPVADRFIMYTQTCDGVDTSSYILLSFSKTNDPASGWYVYKISGNSNTVDKTGTNTWSDYPKIGISKGELFVSVNQFDNSFNLQGVSLYELSKSKGYSGGKLTFKYWSSVSGASHPISGNPFTLLPISQGQGSSYGPGIWIVASAGSPGGLYGSSKIKIYQITDTMTSSSQTMKYFPTTISNAYKLGGRIAQKGDTTKLDNGDCRMQNGFYLNGIIHCVFTSMNSTGVNCINYSRIDVSSGTPATISLSDNKLIYDAGGADLCYPAVASLSSSPTNQTSVITFVRCSGSMYPELDAVRVDDSMNWSSFRTIKAGVHANSICYDNNKKAARWGDYSGIAYRPGQKGAEVWLAGSYGDYSSPYNYWSTQIAQISRNDVGINEVVNGPVTNQRIAPNPVADVFRYSFTLKKNTDINITLLDATGRLLNIMYNGMAQEGDIIFTFNRGALPNGIYFMRISDGVNILGFEKIIVSR